MSFLRNISTVSGMTALSRGLGFVRDLIMSALLGSGPVAEAIIVALRIPNSIRQVFSEGAFNAAFIPSFVQYKNTQEAKRFAEDVFSVYLFAVLLLTAGMQFFMPFIIGAVAFGFADNLEKQALTILLSQIAIPFLAFIMLSAVLAGILNAKGRFIASTMGPILLNIILVSAMLLSTQWTDVTGVFLAAGFSIAGLVQFLLLLAACKKINVSIRLRFPRLTPQIRIMMLQALPIIFTVAITQINALVNTAIVSTQEGAQAWLYYADRLIQLPLALIGISIGVVLLPFLSNRHSKQQSAIQTQHNQNRAVEGALWLAMPASIALFIMAEFIVATLFERGSFTSFDTQTTARALRIYAIALPAFILLKIFAAFYFSKKQTRAPFVFSVMAAVINVTLGIPLFMTIGFTGVVIASCVSAWVQVILMMVNLNKMQIFKLDKRLIKNTAANFVAALIMAAFLWYAHDTTLAWLSLKDTSSLLYDIASLSLLIGASIFVYFVICYGMNTLFLKELKGLLSKKKARKEKS